MKRFRLFLFAVAFVATAGPAAAAAAADNFGRPWFGAASWSIAPAADQLVGIQFVQMRRDLAGVWVEGRTGPTWKTGAGGVAFVLFDGLAARVGATVADGPDHLSVGFAYGITATWRRLAGQVGFDTETGARSFGIGATLWR